LAYISHGGSLSLNRPTKSPVDRLIFGAFLLLAFATLKALADR
jgi:hypothetical protein